MIRVSVIAASAVARAGLEALLRDDGRFVVMSGGPALPGVALSAQPADVALIDVPENRSISSLLRTGEGPAQVLLADNLSRAELRHALHNGARAILGRDSSPQEITAAIAAAAAGLTALGLEQMDALLPTSPERFESAGVVGEQLTPREVEVLGLLAEGAGNKEIAQRLNLSEHTVKFHVSSILAKLGAATRTEAVARGVRQGLILI